MATRSRLLYPRVLKMCSVLLNSWKTILSKAQEWLCFRAFTSNRCGIFLVKVECCTFTVGLSEFKPVYPPLLFLQACQLRKGKRFLGYVHSSQTLQPVSGRCSFKCTQRAPIVFTLWSTMATVAVLRSMLANTTRRGQGSWLRGGTRGTIHTHWVSNSWIILKHWSSYWSYSKTGHLQLRDHPRPVWTPGTETHRLLRIACLVTLCFIKMIYVLLYINI